MTLPTPSTGVSEITNIEFRTMISPKERTKNMYLIRGSILSAQAFHKLLRKTAALSLRIPLNLLDPEWFVEMHRPRPARKLSSLEELTQQLRLTVFKKHPPSGPPTFRGLPFRKFNVGVHERILISLYIIFMLRMRKVIPCFPNFAWVETLRYGRPRAPRRTDLITSYHRCRAANSL